MTSGHVTGVYLLTVDKNLRVFNFTIAQNISSGLDSFHGSRFLKLFNGD